MLFCSFNKLLMPLEIYFCFCVGSVFLIVFLFCRIRKKSFRNINILLTKSVVLIYFGENGIITRVT